MSAILTAILRFFKLRWRLILGIGVSVLCLWLVVRGIDWSKLWSVYSTANYWFLLPAALIIIGCSYARARRWKILIGTSEPISITRLFHIVNIGYLFNNLLPAKVGELVRAYLVGRVVEGGFAKALSTLIVERLLDVLCVVILLVILIPFVTLPAWAARAGLIFGTVAILGVAVLVVLAHFGERGLSWVWRYIGRLPLVGKPRVRGWLANLIAGLKPLTQLRLLPGIALWSFALWFGYALMNYILLAAFRMTDTVSFAVSSFALCATGFGMIVPSSPGAMGVFEGAVVLAFGLYGVDASQAFAYAFGLHMFTNLGLILLGLVGLRAESLSFGQISRQVSQGQADTTSNPPPAADKTE
ncbi:MAG: lysylphosphatidylglycerol synthase transmembrane domain-containing protein [Anaerolineae bacterium]